MWKLNEENPQESWTECESEIMKANDYSNEEIEDRIVREREKMAAKN